MTKLQLGEHRAQALETAKPEKFVAYQDGGLESPPAGTIACHTNQRRKSHAANVLPSLARRASSGAGDQSSPCRRWNSCTRR